MPELAEVMTIAHDLRGLEYVHESRIVDADWVIKKSQSPDVINLIRDLTDGRLRIQTLGKSLVLRRDSGDHLEISLGMTGRMVTTIQEKDKKHLLFTLETNIGTVYFVDYRKFFLLRRSTDLIIESRLPNTVLHYDQGVRTPEPFHPLPLTRTPKIAELLAEGKFTGVGNYLANEALGRLDLNPYTPFADLTEKLAVLTECRSVAIEAFECGGNTFNGGYTRPDGTPGGFKTRYYGRDDIKSIFRARPIYTRYHEV